MIEFLAGVWTGIVLGYFIAWLRQQLTWRKMRKEMDLAELGKRLEETRREVLDGTR